VLEGKNSNNFRFQPFRLEIASSFHYFKPLENLRFHSQAMPRVLLEGYFYSLPWPCEGVEITLDG
jgi:hypothetical protein